MGSDGSFWARGVGLVKLITLWLLAALFVLTGVAHQIEYPTSTAIYGFGLAAILVTPPIRKIILRYVSLSTSLSTVLVLLTTLFGAMVIGADVRSRDDAAAVAKGFASHDELMRASSLGLDSREALIAHDKRAAADAAKAAKRKQELVELERAATTKAKEAAEAACKTNLRCWAEKHTIHASTHCQGPVERLAQYQHEWTDGWLEPKFSHFKWKDKKRGYVTYIGDKIKFQNGFGAWQHHIYACDFDPATNRVLNVVAAPGRL